MPPSNLYFIKRHPGLERHECFEGRTGNRDKSIEDAQNHKEFDDELKQLGNSAIKKLILSGIHFSRIRESDDYIKQTIIAYVRANYRYTDQNIANENRQIFEENKNFMSCTTEYTSEYKNEGDSNG